MMLTKNEKKILKLITFTPVTIVICLSIVATYFFFLDKELDHKENIKKIEKTFIAENKQKVKYEVNRIYDYILYEKANSEESLKKHISNRTDEVFRIINFIYNKYKDTLSKEEITQRIKDSIRELRYNNDRGYFYIYELSGTNILHSLKPNLEGKNLKEFKDNRGIKVVDETIKSLKNSKSSFLEVYWNKPDDLKNEYKKIIYNKVFEPYGWFIGTGEYVDEFEEHIKNKVLSYISKTKYSKNGYVFVVDYDGNYLAHVKKAYIGLNRIDLTDPNGVKITQEVINTAKKGDGYITYVGTIKPETKLPASKTTYIKGFEDWNWSIATGFYTDELDAQVKNMEEQLISKNKSDIVNLIIGSVVITILFLALSLYLSSVLRFRFLGYKKEVLKQMNKNRQKDSMLAQQSKMAAMGEMIQNIAHQWRSCFQLPASMAE